MSTFAPDGNDQELERLRKENENLRRQLGGSQETEAEMPKPVPADSSTSEVTTIREGDITLRRLVQRIAMILQSEMILIMFYERESGELIAIPPSYGLDEHKLQHCKVRATQGITGQVFREGEPIIYHNAETDPRTRKDLINLFKIQNGICVPLIIEHRDEENRIVDRSTIGVLHACNKRHGEDFNDEDVRLLERMAKNVGSIIANLQLYREVMKEREELAQTFESLTSGLLLVSPEGKISQMNSSARAIFRVETDVVGQPFPQVLKDKSLVDFLQSGLGGKEAPPFELFLDFHGVERIYAVQGALVRSDEGRTLGYVSILNDITEQKNIDKMKSSFVAMASHELRTPLTAIKGFSSTLLEAVDDNIYGPEEQKEFLGIVVSECDRLRRLIDDLLNTARIEAGESLKPNYTRFALPPLIEKVAMVQNQASERHHVSVKYYDTMPETIIGDEDKLDQIFTNLLNNAIKYSPEGGDVIIHAKMDGTDCLFGIQDSGIGIPADHLQKVFEKFHRVNNEDNRKIYGTGLGLFLVKHLVDQVHLGKIWVESTVGEGSTFWFRIPSDLDIEQAKKMND
ncbi:MAG: ATP-binding protein [Fimbriimonadaceae bacterium]|jgi:two-component system phosphate regulon sensor histidine kinase PhoR|nr:ATP-binding protein [Fimbriimonadaceae bacterium]